MATTSHPTLLKAASRSTATHPDAPNELCPTCDQPIPHDRFDEIKARIDTRQSALTADITSRLQVQFLREKADAVDRARVEAAAETTAQVAAAREQERRAAEIVTNERLAEAARVSQETQAALQSRIEQTEAAKTAAEESSNALKTQLAQAHHDAEAAVRKVKEEADANAAVIREDARKQAEAAVQEKIAGMERSRHESETALQRRITEAEEAKATAQQSTADLQAQLNQVRADSESAIQKAKQDGDARAAAAREEATAAAVASMQEKVTLAEQGKLAAEAKALAADEQARLLKETHEAQTQERVNEVRSALEAARDQAVNATKAEAFTERQKLSERVSELQRALEKKSADELGEGAEINLLEMLKAEFSEDRFEHVGRGNAGADIIHTVVHNGVACGKIIYDSKDHKQWRYEFATKLAADKIAATADHAILSVRKFPEGARQLHIHDGVIIANPARVLVVVQVVRDHVVKTHALRLSNEAKALKSADLYKFITSTQFSDLLARIDTQAQELLDIQERERRAHEKTWKDQGILFRSIQKTGAELSNRVDIILGTANNAQEAVNDE